MTVDEVAIIDIVLDDTILNSGSGIGSVHGKQRWRISHNFQGSCQVSMAE